MSAFSLRKISIWAFSEDSRDRRLEMISPAVLNVASEGTVVAGADRYCLAKRARCGKRERLDPHQVSGENYNDNFVVNITRYKSFVISILSKIS